MKLRLLVALAAVAVTTVVIAPPASAVPPTGGGSLISAPVTGTCEDALGATGTIVNGVFTVTGFSAQNGQLIATGTLTGVCRTVNGDQVINLVTSTPVTGTQGSCTILDL